MNKMENVKRTPRAFTLVELLVVIGIIGILLSILLPVMGSARHAANTLQCEANLHSIGTAMLLYAQQYNNCILGAPVNTGGAAVLLNSNNAGWPASYQNANFPPGVNQIWDWQTPMLQTMGVKIPYDQAVANDPNLTSATARWERVQFEYDYSLFHCPENQLLGLYSSFGTDFPGVQNAMNMQSIPASLPIPSYGLSLMFLVMHNPLKPKPVPPVTAYANEYVNPPIQYAPRVSLIGRPSEKIFCSDGARYVWAGLSTGNGAPNVNWDIFGGTLGQGGEYADYGAWDWWSRAQNRESAPGNGATKTVKYDERPLWARHGPMLHSNLANQYKFNALFFDGHVETLGDLEGANPIFWLPKGTLVEPGEMNPDVGTFFHLNANDYYTCPE